MRLLSRVVRWTPEGLRYEAGPRHAEQLIREQLVPRSAGSAAPGAQAGAPRRRTYGAPGAGGGQP
eukprot:1242487-Alexandrium_andersonii.AAC.1